MNPQSQNLGDLGAYQLIEQIAVGGMAEIYLAKTRGVAGFEKFLCLKVIHPNYADDDHFIEMLIDEAKIAVSLNHANIVQIFDLGKDGKTYFIAMEFIDGADLFKIMRRLSEKDQDVPLDIATYIAHEICTGLDYAHRKRDPKGGPLGIIHRDISPQNILLSFSGEVKIVDFGIAKAASRSRRTQAGVIKGKYYYMSPEQAWGDTIDQRSDIFSTGIILYEVLTGQMLYLEEDMNRLLDMVRKADIPPPATRRPEIPPQLENVVMKALAKRPADRWQTAHEFQVALTSFLFSYAPDFTPNRLARLIEETLAEDESVKAEIEPAPKRGITRQVALESLMDRVDYRPKPDHSVIFRVQDLLSQTQENEERDSVDTHAEATDPSPLRASRMNEDREEKTMVTGPPSMMPGLFPEPIPGSSRPELLGDDDPTVVNKSYPLPPSDPPPRQDVRPRSRTRSRQMEVVVPHPQEPANAPPPVPQDAHQAHPLNWPPYQPEQHQQPQAAHAIKKTPTWEAPTAPAVDPFLPPFQPRSAPAPAPAPTTPVLTPTSPVSAPASPFSAPTSPVPAPTSPFSAPTSPAPAPTSPAPAPMAQGSPGLHPMSQQPPNTFGPPLPVDPLQPPMGPLAALSHKRKSSRRLRHTVFLSMIGLVALCLAGALILVLQLGTDEGTVEVISVPEGAQISFDDQVFEKPAPVVIPVTDLQRPHIVEVRLANYQIWRRQITLTEEDTHIRVLAVLTPIYGKLEVRSLPEGADVYIAGEHRGKTPLTISNLLPSEDITLELRKKGFRPASRILKWEGQNYLLFEITLTPSR